MAKSDSELNRLFRAAAGRPEPAPEMPFGFDTRVVALFRAAGSHVENGQIAGLLRRVALFATIVLACASSAAYWQFTQNDELGESFSNTYAIADNAIEATVFP